MNKAEAAARSQRASSNSQFDHLHRYPSGTVIQVALLSKQFRKNNMITAKRLEPLKSLCLYESQKVQLWTEKQFQLRATVRTEKQFKLGEGLSELRRIYCTGKETLLLLRLL